MSHSLHHWGIPPWKIGFRPRGGRLPVSVDFAIVGAGFCGLAAAAWLKRLAPQKSVVVLEAFSIGSGASGRTGGMALAETAAGDMPGLGDVLVGFDKILRTLNVKCDLDLRGAWEIARKDGRNDSPIAWNDSGTLRVTKHVPGGSIDPGKLVAGLARAAQKSGVKVHEHHRVTHVSWKKSPVLAIESPGRTHNAKPRIHRLTAAKVLFATNALSLHVSGMTHRTHARLTLATLTDPVSEATLKAIGLALRRPFYTTDFPYLWGRVRKDRSIVFGAGLVTSSDAGNLETVDIAHSESKEIFERLDQRIHGLHPALATVKIVRHWGGPIMFRDTWKPVFGWHAHSNPKHRNGLVVGGFAGHGVALSLYFGTWAAEVLLGKRMPPRWGAVHGTRVPDPEMRRLKKV
ncbi:MAG: FAD-binding oxidoreductase [Candidatus Acidiferrales bacterium]